MHSFDANIYIQKFNELLTLRDLTANTVTSYNSMLRSYLRWVDTRLAKPPEAVSFEEIRKYIIFLKKERCLGNRSINAHISQLAFLYQYILHLPWNKYEVPFMKFYTKLPVVLSPQQAQDLINSISDLRHKAWAALLYSAGLRISEVRHLKCADIQRENMRIYIRPSKSRSDRYAILSLKTLRILEQYWRTFRPSSDWLFPGRIAGNPISKQPMESFLAPYTKHLGWDFSTTAHTLRHSFGTHLYEQGYDLLTIQKLLGHKSTNSSLIYVHLSTRTMSKITSPFDCEVIT